MSDSSKPPSIPSWQRQSGTPPADESSQSPSSSPSSDDAPAVSTRSELVEQAARFLEDESIRTSPTDRKISFLESKGLNTEEIDQLLGVSRNEEASADSSATSDSKQEEPEPSSTIRSPSTQASTVNATPQAQSRPAATTSSRDVAPIITYPEFLVQPAKPPPLVTVQRVLYTLYGAAGLGATIYGASEYLVKPMLANLTDSRHDLFTTASTNLKQLNEKLEASVSEIPPHLNSRKASTLEGDEDEDNDSVTSDPTELFHRDIGTQTTPPLSSVATEIAKEEKEDEFKADAPSRAVAGHMSRIVSIQSQLREINDVEKESSTLDDSMRGRLTDLHHYLDGLIYSAPAYTAAGSSFNIYSGSSTVNGSNGPSTGVRKSEDDAIAGFKAEIRGVKGALLSARNFPASRGGRLGGASAAR